MAQYIDKSAIAAEIERRIKECDKLANAAADNNLHSALEANELLIRQYTSLLYFLDTLEVKEVDLNNGIQLTWEDMRELYIIFAEVDTEIELCKCDIQTETIGYYQEVLKRFKAQKGE